MRDILILLNVIRLMRGWCLKVYSLSNNKARTYSVERIILPDLKNVKNQLLEVWKRCYTVC